MDKKNLTILFLLFTSFTYGQSTGINTRKGEISFGVRTTESLFRSSGNYFGIGAGWQVRYRMAEKLNTEWFADWITTDIGGVGQRYDSHIGESMIIYPGKKMGQKNTFTPFVLGGFCGDYTKIQANPIIDEELNSNLKKSKDRWSFATQLGFGTHYNFTERFDISFTSQYVLHFGSDIDAQVRTNDIGEKYLQIEKEKGSNLEGHIFITISANFVIADLCKK